MSNIALRKPSLRRRPLRTLPGRNSSHRCERVHAMHDGACMCRWTRMPCMRHARKHRQESWFYLPRYAQVPAQVAQVDQGSIEVKHACVLLQSKARSRNIMWDQTRHAIVSLACSSVACHLIVRPWLVTCVCSTYGSSYCKE